MKYMPVLRYRESERKTLLEVGLSNKTLPLIEIVQEKRKSNMKTTCFEEIKEYLKNTNTKILIDFPMYITIKGNTIEGARKFLTPILANPALRLSEFKKFVGTKIIPVASYNPNTPLWTNGLLSNEITKLRSDFDQLALRIFTLHAQSALQEAEGLLKEGDLLILDIDNAPPTNPAFSNFFAFVQAFARRHGCVTILLRSVIDTSITNTGLQQNKVVSKLDNSLLTEYSRYGFDAFGDFCGIKKDDLTDGGMPSPGCIFYHWWSNAYYGHKGIYKQPKTFTTMVLPSLTSSKEWGDYSVNSSAHHFNCPGCLGIKDIITNGNGDAAPKWKNLMASHYLHTMEEFL